MTKITITLPDDRAQELAKAAAKTGLPAEEWLREKVEKILQEQNANESIPERSLTPRKKGMEAFKEFWATLPKDKLPPTDEEVEKILEERRIRKYG
jgi:hypothetical protein